MAGGLGYLMVGWCKQRMILRWLRLSVFRLKPLQNRHPMERWRLTDILVNQSYSI